MKGETPTAGQGVYVQEKGMTLIGRGGSTTRASTNVEVDGVCRKMAPTGGRACTKRGSNRGESVEKHPVSGDIESIDKELSWERGQF